jgi:hypothetical protein
VLETEKHILLVTMHHIISDAWSTGIFIQELSTLYNAFSQNKPSPMTELPIQYADFALWQKHCLQSHILQKQLHYWQKQLEGANTSLLLPTDKPSTQVTTSLGAKYSFKLSATHTQQLEIFSQQEGVTLFMTLLAAYNTLLYYYTKQTDILVGSAIANRNHSDLEGLIGFFVNTLVLRTELSNNPSFRELLQRVRKIALEAYTHQDIPFDSIVQAIQPERNLKRNPFFQVWFVLQNAPQSEFKLSGLNLTLLEEESGVVRHDLKLECNKTSTEIHGFFEYKTELFSFGFITSLGETYQNILEIIVKNPEITLTELIQLLDKMTQEKLTQSNHQKLGQIKRKVIGGTNAI